MKIKQIFSSVTFLLLFFITHIGFTQIVGFRNYSAREGLLQSQVQTILQDDEGYLWFGTYNGIYRFNGEEFKNITKLDGLVSNYILCGFKDASGNLYFGHNNGLVSKYNWKTGRFKEIRLVRQNSNINYSVSSFAQDAEGKIWIGAEGGGVFVYDSSGVKHLGLKQGLASLQVMDLKLAPDSTMWIATASGMNIADTHKLSLSSLPNDSTFYNTLLILENNYKWLAAINGEIHVLDANNKLVKIFSAKQGLKVNIINNMYEDSFGRKWIASDENGAFGYIPGGKDGLQGYFKHYTTKNGLSFNRITAIFEDREGNIWFATGGGGACMLRDERFRVYTDKLGLIDNSVWSFYEDAKGNIWIGSNEGISVIGHKNGLQERPRPSLRLQSKINSVMQFTEDKEHNLWAIAFQKAIYKKNRNQNIWKKVKLPRQIIAQEISTIVFGVKTRLWIGTIFEGIFIVNPQTMDVTHLSRKSGELASDSIKVLFRDSQDRIWIGPANGGIVMYDGKVFHRYDPSVGSAISFTEDRYGDIWLITNDDELYRLRNGQFENLTNRGLEGQTLYSVIADSTSIWVGTTRGAARLVFGKEKFEYFGFKEGAPIAETNQNAVMKDSRGHIWFGTIEGAVEFVPDEVKYNRVPPQTYITGIEISHEPTPMKAAMKLPYDKNYLTFRFIGLSFAVPEKVLYKYKLQGFDQGWSPATHLKSATYSNLPPGDYRFLVQACNNDGVWNANPVAYAFTIRAPFWQRSWFIILTVLLASLFIYFIIRIRTIKIERDRRILEKRVKSRTEELRKEKEELEKALHALNESEAKFRAYTELASSGIYIHKSNHFCYVNPAGQRISGYSWDELMNMNIWDLVYSGDVEFVKNRFLARVSGQKVPERYEFRFITKEGEIRWLDFTGRVIEYEGDPAVLATVFDITDRKLAEEALMAEKERLAVTLRAIGDGVISAGVNQEILLSNKKAEEILSCKIHGLEGKRFEDIFKIRSETDGTEKENPIKQVIQSEGSRISEENAVLTDVHGNEHIIEYSSAPLKDKESNLIGVVIVFRDITQRRKMEQELLESQKLESVGVLAGGIAHDFNNILTAIIGNLSLAKMHLTPGDKIYKRIESAEKASGRAQELTQQLLTFSKGGAPVKELASIEEIIRDSVEFILSGSNVKYNLHFEENLPAVDVDSGQMSQVVQNLVLNADQAMPSGGILDIVVSKVCLEKTQDADLPPGEYICMKCTDNGIGIPKDYLNKIFDPFFSTKQTGSGLGLATSYTIIKNHSGKITVESVMGEGTTFTVYLPASAKVSPKSRPEAEPIENCKLAGKVLIMDDELFIRETAGEMLNYLGLQVDYAEDGAQALELYQKNKKQNAGYDVVIMDLTIPGGMGGKEAITKLLEIDPQATVIVSSGYSSDSIMSDFERYGFKGVLKKPFRLREITQVLSRLLNGRKYN